MRGRDAKSVITARERNRALLARQLLLERSSLRPLAVVERLIGMQAQTPRSPYTALWSRVVDFDPMTLSRAIATRRAVRIALMRSTIHLVTARDALRLRPLMAPPLARELATPTWRTRLAGLDLDELAARARIVLGEAPRTPKQLGAALAQDWPDRDPRALAHAARCLLPLVQLPPRGTWDGSSATTLALAEQWLGRRPIDAAPDWDTVALRYFAAFGPATAADMIAWSRVTGLGEVISRLRPRLRVLHDEDGRELFDLPRAPRPAGSTPAPPRFLPDYDNLLLAHADRNHVFPDAHRRAMQGVNGVLPGTVLVDGAVAASWSVERAGDAARLLIRCLDLPHAARAEVRQEGLGLLGLLAGEARRTEVTFAG